MQTSNSFPYAVALQFRGEGTDNLNTLGGCAPVHSAFVGDTVAGRRSGNRVAITMSPGENMRCNQVLYSPDASVRSSHFKDYAHWCGGLYKNVLWGFNRGAALRSRLCQR